jgi:hypothetical protein
MLYILEVGVLLGHNMPSPLGGVAHRFKGCVDIDDNLQ